MTKKQIKILIFTFIVIFLIVFIVFLLTNNGDEVENVDININKTKIDNFNNTELEAEIIEEPVIERKKEDITSLKIKSVAKNFTERYGTWSTDNKDENFKSAKVYTTSRMENIIEDFIINNEKLADSYEGYYGVTTKALSVKIINLEENEAKLSVSVQQLETSGINLDNNISYKNLNLELIKNNDDWFVNDAKWE
jgi:hypothetical protein